ncbi:hypothetical protein GALL_517440 [mine drainage metagenome]|uniref:Uncharacterized protein n=1 Tax=mine drainage metagenome TaxID=410659 RepID=A0A1J5PSZ3_9ZZZZ
MLLVTVHTAGVAEAMLTVRPELALALKVGVATPMVWLPGDVKLMVWVVSTGVVPPFMPVPRVLVMYVAMLSAVVLVMVLASAPMPPWFSRMASKILAALTASGMRAPWQLTQEVS